MMPLHQDLMGLSKEYVLYIQVDKMLQVTKSAIK